MRRSVAARFGFRNTSPNFGARSPRKNVDLASGVAEIRHAYVVRDASGEEHYGEVAITGPNESPETLGRRARSAMSM